MVWFLEQDWNLQSIIWGTTLTQYVYYFVTVAGFLLLGRLFQFVLLRYGKKLAAHTKSDWDDVLIDAVTFLARYFPFIIGLALAAKLFLTFPSVGAEEWYFRVVGLLGLGTVVYTLLRFIDLFTERILLRIASQTNAQFNNRLVPLVKRVLKYVVIILFILVTLDNFGFDITAILAGLGIGGLAVAFAAQETIRDVFGGFTIFANKSFFVGDYITAGTVSGRVESIHLRTTRIRNPEGRIVTVPNSQLASQAVENWSAAPGRRTQMTIALAPYLDSKKVEQAKNIIRTILEKNDGIVQDTKTKEKILIWLSDLLPNTLNLNVVYFVKDAEFPQSVWDNVNTSIKSQFEKEKIPLAGPVAPQPVAKNKK